MKALLPLALSFILTACAQTTISSAGKSDDAIRADMNSCNAGSLTLHNLQVINCLSLHGDTITYSDGRIPPYTTGNPYGIPLTAPEVQARKAAATAVLERWKAAARNNAQNVGVTAVAPTPVATAPSTTSSGAGATTTDEIRSELKEVRNGSGNQVFPTGGQGIYERNFLNQAEGIANFFYLRNSDFTPGPGIPWSTNKDLQDFVKAKRWYQIALIRAYHGQNPNVASRIADCDFQLSNARGSARSEIAEKKNLERIESDKEQEKLAVRKKVGDCVVIPGGTGFLGLASTVGTVTRVSGDTIFWVAHLHRNGHWEPAILGGHYYVAPENFDREGSSKYNEVSLCE